MAGRKQRSRGRGRGSRGRGLDRGGGRGRGGRGRGRGRGVGYTEIEEIDGDFAISFHHKDRHDTPKRIRGKVTSSDDFDNSSRYPTPVHWQGASPSRGNGFQRGSSQWGGYTTPNSLGPQGRVRKRHLESKLHYGTASISQLLYEDRPLLKPLTFVRSMHTPTLFLKEEEIFKPVAEEAGEQQAGYVPTAERIYRIFHGGDPGPNSSESPSDLEELLEIDFADLGKIMDEVEAVAASSRNATGTNAEEVESQSATIMVEERFTGVCINTKPPPMHDLASPTNDIAVGHPNTHILGKDVDGDDEIIVYVAPYPRKGKLVSNLIRSSSAAPAPFPSIAETPTPQETHSSPHATTFPPQPVPKGTPASSLPPAPIPVPALTSKEVSFSHSPRSPWPTHPARRPNGTTRRRPEQHAMFGSFGAIRAEATLHELDPWRDEQRHGDSDVDWGGSTSEESEQDEDMLVDQDLDVGAMKSFVRTMSATGQTHVSAGDLEDEARIRAEEVEESDSESRGSEDEGDTELELADDVRDMLVSAEDGGTVLATSPVKDNDESTSDEEETPKRSFQARLERLRRLSEGRPIKDVLREELDKELDGDESDYDIDDGESIIAKIPDFLDENDEIHCVQDRRQRNRIFQAIHNGKFEVDIGIAGGPASRKKDKHVPEELRRVWERDRAKKAERKRLRELERIAAAADPFAPNKGGKKARKARLAATSAVPVTVETVVGHMRRFVADIGGSHTLSLPPMDRKLRKSVHELAHAFKLKSKSQGKDAMRFTTLTKTTLSGVKVDEKKILGVLGDSLPSSYVTHRGRNAKGWAGKRRPRDGEVVGEAAPKLDGSNVGFRMLSAMGWEEGGRIGVVGGLGAPLVAVIKTTKLGLGASRG